MDEPYACFQNLLKLPKSHSYVEAKLLNADWSMKRVFFFT